MIRTKTLKKFGACALSLLVCLWSLPGVKYAEKVSAVEDTTISSPVLGSTVTWDCVYFGSYPQGEITETENRETYQMLQSSKEWKNDNTLTVNGMKYKRVQKKDATSTGSSYHWGNDSTYHYFTFEPIKWRVIGVKENLAYLISDVALDTQKYNQQAREVSWNTSSLRSWLNGYGASENQAKMDYSSSNFADTAFDSTEKDTLVSTNSDKITILSEEDLKKNTGYGFGNQDGRTCRSSSYAQAMGVRQDTSGICNWWTSTNGNSNLTAKYIQQSGEVYSKGFSVVYAGNGVRAAVTIDLKQTGTYRYAGTVSSDGTVREPVSTTVPVITPTAIPTVTAVPTKTPAVTSTKTASATPEVTATTSVKPTSTPMQTPTKEPEKTTPAPTKVPETTPTATATAKPAQNSIKKGSTWSHTASNGTYRVTTIRKSADKDGTIGTVTYLGMIKKNKTSVTIPATVTIKKQKFKVTAIANSAFTGNKKLKKVVIGKNIKKIGANAYKGCKNLSKITIHTTGLTKTSIGKKAFQKISAKAVIQIPGSKWKKYKTWIKAAGVAKTVVFKKV